MKIIIIDNYDSFTYNLVHLVNSFSGMETVVKRNDDFTLAEINAYDKIILSPGPGLPKDAGLLMEVLKEYAATKNILGVCLGHQAIGCHYGATLQQLTDVVHGRQTKIITTHSNYILKNIPTTFEAGRYHSWVVRKNDLPGCLQIIAEDEQGNIMAMQHKTHQVLGIQFHPESIMTQVGKTIVENWLKN